MKKLTALITILAAFVAPAAAHAGISHAYTGRRVSLLILLLWISLAAYQELGDTWKGHWVLFSGVFTAFYVPLFHPHTPVTASAEGFLVIVAAVVLIGTTTFLRHRNASEAEENGEETA